ncbi:hypothetical protein OEZ86_005941 [Tetradesmus obliquus]|nr:hypothetical protein OEZ86_005941 [Tetradesmus obliquus]
MARRQLLALCAVLLVAQGALAAAPKPADIKPPQKPSEHLKPEAAPQQQLGLLLPTGGQPGMAMMALPAAAATDPRLPGDGVMGLGGPPVIPGVTPTAGSSSKDMIGSSSYDSVFGSSVGSMSSGSMAGLSSSDPFSATAAMGGSGTLGGSGAGALGMGANGDASQALRNRRAAMNAAGSSQLAKGVAGLALLAAALLL